VLSRDEGIVPVIGARRTRQLEQALGALAFELAPAKLAAIEGAVPAGAVAGTRYDPRQMATLDSERAAAG
jgi:aryl-alcohol dehydrogenase-like predicted oxidoreductase